ncbi:CYTH domain-containing protein [Emcibacter sp.]|uniref:CYTH domain-containing protein n=1 Tax=Emcibacter sp. TaxID=1979954 RepID=UPI002AA67C6A|nr:CYTH domain-containing protein [Emcibacter sp.]
MSDNPSNVEIERKFLVSRRPDGELVKRQAIRQGYIAREGGNTVRIRQKNDKFILSIKSSKGRIERYELEYEVSEADATLLFKLCTGNLIEKTREVYGYKGHLWEVDIFHGVNDGLIIAEVELDRADEAVLKPDWIGREVSQDARFFNAYLFSHPFIGWDLTYDELLAGK